MLVDHRAEDRRRHDRQILQAFIVTMAGFWVTVLLIVWVITPLRGGGVWPLLELPYAATGQKAPDRERDVWVSVRANGEIFVDEMKVAVPQLPADPERRVFVRVDRNAPFGAVRRVVRAAQQAGRRQLTFTAKPLDAAAFVPPAPLSCTDPGVVAPVLISHSMPNLGDIRIHGSPLILELAVDENGNVESVRVIRGVSPPFDDKFVRAAYSWKFRPATSFGKPVPCAMHINIIIDVK